ncbi:uncharacterized protein LOC107360179 [Tetranychus urticae]|uniref:uncharacterized protein LOC107360179 n=1 Tax=Tetranychus urticae TaxID=32264 RepID=UPI00077BA179|nr:uncharacterized protein LOC107360179 [Tetranychus urticae]
MSEVIKRRGPYKSISNDVRASIVQSIRNNVPKEQIISVYGLKRQTYESIERVWIKENRVTKKKKGGTVPKLNDSDKILIKEWLDENISLTLKDLVNKIRVELNKNVSQATVDRAIKGFHYSVKRVSLVPERRNDATTIEKRYDYARQFISIQHQREKIFFIDEFGIQIHSRTNYGRSLIGSRANRKVRSIRSRNYSVCAAMCAESLFFFELKDTPYNASEFNLFLEKLFEHFSLANISNAYVIMDNVPFHKTQIVKDLFANSGHIQIFLPPYSPFLNPIENLFSQWKNYIKRSESQSEDELYSNVNSCSEVITSDHCKNYFSNMESYLIKCLDKLVIEN